MYHIIVKDSEITKNLIVFFILIAGLTFLLGLLGYRKLTGIDISKSMLKVAQNKGIYSELKNADLLSDVKSS